MYRIWLSVLGTGYSPFASGTCGSAVPAAVFFLTAWLSGSPWVTLLVMGLAAVHGWIVTILWGDRLIAELGPDPGVIVSDEQCGQAITFLWWWPVAAWSVKDLLVFVAAGFILFRLFDIIKPPPVRQLEKIKGAWGVLLDDVMAGLYAQICLHVFWWGIWKNFSGS